MRVAVIALVVALCGGASPTRRKRGPPRSPPWEPPAPSPRSRSTPNQLAQQHYEAWTEWCASTMLGLARQRVARDGERARPPVDVAGALGGNATAAQRPAARAAATHAPTRRALASLDACAPRWAAHGFGTLGAVPGACLLYTSPSPRDGLLSRMPSSA